MISDENSISEPPNLKFSWRRIPLDPPKRLDPLALALNMPPVRKNLATALHSCGSKLPCRRAKVALGHDKQENIHNFNW